MQNTKGADIDAKTQMPVCRTTEERCSCAHKNIEDHDNTNKGAHRHQRGQQTSKGVPGSRGTRSPRHPHPRCPGHRHRCGCGGGFCCGRKGNRHQTPSHSCDGSTLTRMLSSRSYRTDPPNEREIEPVATAASAACCLCRRCRLCCRCRRCCLCRCRRCCCCLCRPCRLCCRLLLEWHG